jgi:ComF family protein
MLQIMYSLLKNVLYPPFCSNCKKEIGNAKDVLCSACNDLIHPIVSIAIPVYGQKHMPVFALADYKDPLRALIMAKHGMRPIAAKQMAYLMWRHLPLAALDFDYLVPIPLHWTRYALRGYNQCAITASYLSHLSGKPMVHALRRNRRTALQASLHGAEARAHNVADAFTLATNDITNKKIVLIDDLMTTGSTLRAAARVLYKQGAQSVQGVVLCRVI